MRSSEVGSAQCRSSKASATGCERAPARTQATSAASCRRRNSSGASFAARVLRQRDVDQRRDQGRIFGRIQADQRQRVLEVGEALLGRRRSAPNRWRPHSAIGCSGVFCNSCDDDPFDPGVRRLGELAAKLFDKARLADAGLADDRARTGLRLQRARPAPSKSVELLLAPDERRQRPRAAAPPPPLARTMR